MNACWKALFGGLSSLPHWVHAGEVAKLQFVGCDCVPCNLPFVNVVLALLAKEFEAELVYIYDNLYYLTKHQNSNKTITCTKTK